MRPIDRDKPASLGVSCLGLRSMPWEIHASSFSDCRSSLLIYREVKHDTNNPVAQDSNKIDRGRSRLRAYATGATRRAVMEGGGLAASSYVGHGGGASAVFAAADCSGTGCV